MPRPRRAYGRPGTRVIPPNWGASHAPVAAGTFTGTCVVRAPGAGSEPVMGEDFSFTEPAAVAPLYVGGCRIQALRAQDRTASLGGQEQRTSGYLVAIDYAAVDIPILATVEVTASSDLTLIEPGRRLIVRDIDRGTVRFERDLYCVDDLTWRPEPAPEPELEVTP